MNRDYRSASDSIVKIYNNRIEFYNPGRLPDSITAEDLLSNNYKSTPRNKLCADFCKSIGLIEKYGSGVQRIIKYFKDAQLPIPEFRNISEGFMVTVFAEKSRVGEKVGEKVGEILTKNQELIIQNIRENNRVSAKQLSEKIGISSRKVEDNLRKLKQKNILRRIGAAKGGHWEIIENVWHGVKSKEHGIEH